MWTSSERAYFPAKFQALTSLGSAVRLLWGREEHVVVYLLESLHIKIPSGATIPQTSVAIETKASPV